MRQNVRNAMLYRMLAKCLRFSAAFCFLAMSFCLRSFLILVSLHGKHLMQMKVKQSDEMTNEYELGRGPYLLLISQRFELRWIFLILL